MSFQFLLISTLETSRILCCIQITTEFIDTAMFQSFQHHLKCENIGEEFCTMPMQSVFHTCYSAKSAEIGSLSFFNLSSEHNINVTYFLSLIADWGG